jgi:hypothetical protein
LSAGDCVISRFLWSFFPAHELCSHSRMITYCALTANWEQAQSSFFTFNPLDFAHFCRANDQIDAKGKQLATTAANKALMLQACPPATSGPFALV